MSWSGTAKPLKHSEKKGCLDVNLRCSCAALLFFTFLILLWQGMPRITTSITKNTRFGESTVYDSSEGT